MRRKDGWIVGRGVKRDLRTLCFRTIATMFGTLFIEFKENLYRNFYLLRESYFAVLTSSIKIQKQESRKCFTFYFCLLYLNWFGWNWKCFLAQHVQIKNNICIQINHNIISKSPLSLFSCESGLNSFFADLERVTTEVTK